MMNLRVSLVQTDLVWEDPAANCAQLEEKLAELADKTDVVVLPEMFATGFSMSPAGAEIGKGPVLQWMQVQANRLGALIVGFNINWIMDHVFFAPTKNDFITFRVINHYSQEFFGHESFVLPDTFQVQQKKLLQQFDVMMSVSIFGGMVLALPYIIWELWRFISPALHPRERKNSSFVI